jgi:hypothetical protein
MEKIKWLEKVTNKEVLQSIRGKRLLLNNILHRRTQLEWTYSTKKLSSS